jgi:hypothetical protein
MSRKGIVYALGVCFLGLTQGWLRSTFGDLTSFIIAIGYIVLIRFIAEKFAKEQIEENS